MHSRYSLGGQSVKDNNMKLIGYIRKSPSNESHQARLASLVSMCERLRTMSNVDIVYASYSSKADAPFNQRDTKCEQKIPGTAGNTQDFLHFLSTETTPIAIVAIDFAGLTTSPIDLIDLLRYDSMAYGIDIFSFLPLQLELCFAANPSGYPNDRAKIIFAVSHLAGNPFKYMETFIPIINQPLQNLDNNPLVPTPSFTYDYKAFREHMSLTFGDINPFSFFFSSFPSFFLSLHV
ncbi:hypothetical protein DM01DRAFT_264777 [Hesseltinella vesiculosa]|uniref:Uncharacterized protein n=1 Tax=Hesseltinella vesiculosa TaxID=101127 RepID=A0A1X2GEW1_9FUNG|nr:hypothetical protein DM01DRAFT_264777 [Hesseltinella vesiculosa]